MKRLAGLSVFIVLVLMIQGMAFAGSGSRLMKEIVGPDQKVEYAQSRPIIISKKEYNMALAPESILVAPKTYIRFTLVVYNPKDEPLSISPDNVKVSLGEKSIELLSVDALAEETRKDILKDYKNLSKDQMKALKPFIDDKVQRVRKACLKGQKVPPKKRVETLFGLDIPMRTPKVTIEVITPKDTHSFSFNIIDL